VAGYNARHVAASYAALEAAFFTAALSRADDLNEQRAAFAEALDPVPESTYREEAEAVGLHPPI